MDVIVLFSKTVYMYKPFQHCIRLSRFLYWSLEPENLWPGVHLKRYFLVIYVDLCCVPGTGGGIGYNDRYCSHMKSQTD